MKSQDFNCLPLSGWFPGHMLKAGRQIQERLSLVDVAVELLDARVPATSRNPALEKALAARPRLVLFNKADLADPQLSAEWERRLTAEGEAVLFVDAASGAGVSAVLPRLRELWEEERGRRGATRPALHPLRVMIVGIPNVGKSTLVNRLAARRKAAVGPKPGVTRQQQWVVLEDNAELLDTPGVAWPRVADKCAELKLGLAGTIRDEVLGEELLAEFLWFSLQRSRSPAHWALYGLGACPPDPETLIEAVAVRRGLLRGGGGMDRQRAAVALLTDFRAGRLGRFTLDLPAAG